MRPSPPALLADIGRALYGAAWISPMERALDLPKGTIRHAMAGRRGLPAGIMDAALALMERRAAEIAAAARAARARITAAAPRRA